MALTMGTYLYQHKAHADIFKDMPTPSYKGGSYVTRCVMTFRGELIRCDYHTNDRNKAMFYYNAALTEKAHMGDFWEWDGGFLVKKLVYYTGEALTDARKKDIYNTPRFVV